MNKTRENKLENCLKSLEHAWEKFREKSLSEYVSSGFFERAQNISREIGDLVFLLNLSAGEEPAYAKRLAYSKFIVDLCVYLECFYLKKNARLAGVREEAQQIMKICGNENE